MTNAEENTRVGYRSQGRWFQTGAPERSHRQFVHSAFGGVVTLSGQEGHDAKRYQEKQVAEAIAIAKKPN
jgi:predicted RNA binding protein YcfA (HicA-like mRNA interferase family)